jgi:lipoprotein-anchoring transpeptidase ErfK/SrfK
VESPLVAQQGGKKQYPEFKKIVPKSEEERLKESLKERPTQIVKDNTRTNAQKPETDKKVVKKPLESGIIVDKGENILNIIKDGEVSNAYNVITGKNLNGNRNDYPLKELEKDPSLRVTPEGGYTMRPEDNIYGAPGFMIDPIETNFYPKPLAKSIAIHNTSSSDRLPLYNKSVEDRYASYGCINCKKEDVTDIYNSFSKPDTVFVVNSNNEKGSSFIKNYNNNDGWKDFLKDRKQQGGDIPISSRGVYEYPGQDVIVPTTDGRITMNSINYPIKGTDEFGNTKMMMPGGEYKFLGKTIKEEPQLTEAEKHFLKELNKI